MLIEGLNNLSSEEIHNIYNVLWQDKGYSDEDIRQHIARYIVQFYRLRHMSDNCKEKATKLINELRAYIKK
jgi:hypothetical protein